MRIVNRETFLAMPSGTVFVKFPAQTNGICISATDELSVKGDSLSNDFYYQTFIPDYEGSNNSDDYQDIIFSMLDGKSSPSVEYNVYSRDGLFDADQLFLVWDKPDLEAMIAMFTTALESYADG